MFSLPEINPASETPLYRQLYEQIRDSIASGRLARGQRLPATRELAGLLGLNRTTVSAAYELLESEQLITGHVGRGSFVSAGGPLPGSGLDWERLLGEPDPVLSAPRTAEAAISFASSRPAEDLFPMEEVRLTCQEVLSSPQAPAVLQLGAPAGYAPLRHYLREQARAEGLAAGGDDVLITNGCQQGLDLLSRVLIRPGDPVIVEDPVYPGLRAILARAGARLSGVPVAASGIDVEVLEAELARTRPRMLVLTPSFQNPTGGTLPLSARQAVLHAAARAGTVLVENDVYGDLRYAGEPLPTLRQLDGTGDVVLVRSFSKIAFPGLRVGWVIGPAALVSRLAQAKQWTDLHSDQLSQAILLRFAETGRLAAHHQRVVAAGAERLAAVTEACQRHLPAGSHFTRPQGGMNLWVRLPEVLDAGEMLARAERENVSYLPGRVFAVSRPQSSSLRLSFAGLPAEKIRAGVAILGGVFAAELERARALRRLDPAPAMV